LTKVPGPLATKSLFVLALQCPQVEISGGQFLALLNPFPSFCVANGAKDKDLIAKSGRDSFQKKKQAGNKKKERLLFRIRPPIPADIHQFLLQKNIHQLLKVAPNNLGTDITNYWWNSYSFSVSRLSLSVPTA